MNNHELNLVLWHAAKTALDYKSMPEHDSEKYAKALYAGEKAIKLLVDHSLLSSVQVCHIADLLGHGVHIVIPNYMIKGYIPPKKHKSDSVMHGFDLRGQRAYRGYDNIGRHRFYERNPCKIDTLAMFQSMFG